MARDDPAGFSTSHQLEALMLNRLVLVFLLLAVVGCPFLVAADPPKDPSPLKNLADAEAAAQAEMAKLKGRTEDEIVKKLGKPSDKQTWKFKGKTEPSFEYKVGKATVLRLYFYQGKVVYISLVFKLDV